MRPIRVLVPLFAFITTLSACDGIGGDGWITSERESSIDGATITVQKDFTREGNVTMVRASLVCRVNASDVTLAVESYNAQSVNDQFAGSPFVIDGNAVKGRIVAQGMDGSRQEGTFGELFTAGEYNNIATFDVAESSAAAWLLDEEEAFWRWAAEHAPQRGEASVEDFAESLAQTAGALTMFGGLQALLTGATAESITEAAAAQIAPEFVANARAKRTLGPLGTGAALRRMLPMTIEIYNQGGAFELTIPADNKDVNALLERCAGTPWWQSSPASTASAETESVAPKATGEVESAKEGSTADQVAEREMREALESLVIAEEAFFADNSTYAASLKLLSVTMEAGATVTLERGDATGFSATASHVATKRTCRVSVGATDGPDHEVRCG